MELWDQIIHQSKDCHTKQAWKDFFTIFQIEISKTTNSKYISDIFKSLHNDPQSPNYDPIIFGSLILGCLSSWNLDLGLKIFKFVENISAPEFVIPAAKLHLERGQPQKTKQITQKSLRLKNLSIEDEIQLEMLLISAFTEEGKNKKAISLLAKLGKKVQSTTLNPKENSEIKNQMARVYYFFGKYPDAGKLFSEASSAFKVLQDWEAATKAYFNAASSYHNSGNKYQTIAFDYLRKSQLLSEQYNLKGPLAHIESFYAVDAYNHGNFKKAIEHLIKANRLTPDSDTSYRKLHLLSMLTINYLITGQYQKAQKIGENTLKLAELDESNRQRTRYLCLKAELLWEQGNIIQSQTILEDILPQFKMNGVKTLEELYTYTRYLHQSSLLNKSQEVNLNLDIDNILKENIFNWLEFLCAKVEVLLSLNEVHEADNLNINIIERSIEHSDFYHKAISYKNSLEISLRKSEPESLFSSKLNLFKKSLSDLGETPLDAKLLIFQSAHCYHKGEFDECIKFLKMGLKNSKINFADKFVLESWIKTAEGKSSKLSADWQEALIANQTKRYFKPNIRFRSDTVLTINGIYDVDLIHYPTLSELIKYLMTKPNHKASTSELQIDVWNQSLNTQGWQQKIRNSIMRLRSLIHYSMAPLIIQKLNEVYLFHNAIEIVDVKKEIFISEEPREQKIQNLVLENPMSSIELSKTLELSPATTKRTLKKMVENGQLQTIKEGRGVLYTQN